MGQTTGISWTDSTPVIDRGGRRIRFYKKLIPSRPGTQIRRQMRANGLSLCRGCKAWIPCDLVSVQGLCRPHANAEYRKHYPGFRDAVSARKMARKRGLRVIPPIERERIFERFNFLCAYCGDTATTIDHVIPVKHGGGSIRGNLLPACSTCNSRKRTKSLEEFLEICASPSDQILDELCMLEIL